MTSSEDSVIPAFRSLLPRQIVLLGVADDFDDEQHDYGETTEHPRHHVEGHPASMRNARAKCRRAWSKGLEAKRKGSEDPAQSGRPKRRKDSRGPAMITRGGPAGGEVSASEFTGRAHCAVY